MDRAHRLGQRKVVNVHRLIMRGTLEEKVMSLQKFKVSIANAIINADNASMNTMNTDQLLDLFTSAEAKKVLFHHSVKFLLMSFLQIQYFTVSMFDYAHLCFFLYREQELLRRHLMGIQNYRARVRD